MELLRLREKLLIDRFKGQIVWLELRKQKMKEQGQTAEIITIKKKQRALLLRLQNERNEIHRLVLLTQMVMRIDFVESKKINHIAIPSRLQDSSNTARIRSILQAIEFFDSIKIETHDHLWLLKR